MSSACAQHDFHEKSNYIIMKKKNMLLVPKRGFADENIRMVPMLWVKMLRIECCPVLVLEGHQDKEIV